MSPHDDRPPRSFDPRTWEALPRFDPSNPPAADRPRPVLHTAGAPDAAGVQRCVRCAWEFPLVSPPHRPGTVLSVGEGKAFDSVVCSPLASAAPAPRRR